MSWAISLHEVLLNQNPQFLASGVRDRGTIGEDGVSGRRGLPPGFRRAPVPKAHPTEPAAILEEDCQLHKGPGCPGRSPYTKYFSIRIPSFWRAESGIEARSVRMAWASADPHLQARLAGIRATAAATTLHAFSEFCLRLLMMSLTVTAS